MSFAYRGEIGVSKSIYNRALIVQSFYPDLQIRGETQSEDVLHLQQCLMVLQHGYENNFNCGEGGTSFRFLLARLSREVGTFTLFAEDRLLKRPHQDLLSALKQLGVDIEVKSQSYQVTSTGWHIPEKPIELRTDHSSQYASALLLSSWELEKPLRLRFVGDLRGPSMGYFWMTFEFLKSLGMKMTWDDQVLTMEPQQKCVVGEVKIEPDMSSAFALAACAVADGELIIPDFPDQSLQPDFHFIEILKQMGAKLDHSPQGKLVVRKSRHLKPLEISVAQTPDLFPVLAILLSQASGVSRISGLSQLEFKESDRLQNTQDLLASLGYQTTLQNKVLMISGEPRTDFPEALVFNPDHDHRMAMAAAVAKLFGASIEIQEPEVVNKSCPEFWKILSSC